jgi:RsiW-degrading membrane proteinase PrsW (M82 family)
MVPFYETDISSVIGKFFYALLGVALIEESVKYFGAKFSDTRNPVSMKSMTESSIASW